ncbi:hypothetical protein [Azonexus sp.]|uniref:hypothetical protein n=1 Tax=Azonexus sp. TaxID=1872668 RepID=UPI002835A747|nr:hypothetical protein [Azonexus sp.]MDR1995147.1 hypothetical protein [Azonexus sp.]
MTPEQKSAVESVAGRALTADEIAAIEPLLSVRDDVGIAAILSVGRVRVEPTPIGIGTCLAVMAPAGGIFLDTLEQIGAADPNVKWSLKMIEQGTFDIGHIVTRAQLLAFADANPLVADAVRSLLAVAEQPDPIHYNAVSDALNVAEGRMTLGD